MHYLRPIFGGNTPDKKKESDNEDHDHENRETNDNIINKSKSL